MFGNNNNLAIENSERRVGTRRSEKVVWGNIILVLGSDKRRVDEKRCYEKDEG